MDARISADGQYIIASCGYNAKMKFFSTTSDTGTFSHLIDETIWGEIQKKE